MTGNCSKGGSDRDAIEDTAFELRTFGRRRGRKISPRQQQLMETVLPRVALDLGAPAASVLAQLSDSYSREVWLEIGFGGGEHIVWQAQQNVHVGIIGCEPFEEGIVKVLTAIDEQPLANIRLHADDARDVLRWLPEASIDRAFVLFPDPWPKARHKKRRLVNPSTLEMVARALRPGGVLRIATDIGDYARTMLTAFQGVPKLRWTAQAPEDWRVRPPDWPQTRYEEKALREGRRCYFLSFERVEAPAK